jgi:hypothetical protein
MLGAMLIGILTATPCIAQNVDSSEFFESRIRPILANSCYACHTSSQLGNLRVDSRDALLKGGKSGPAVVPGKPEESLLIRAVRQVDERLKMPMGGTLQEQEISDLTTWVKMGAPWPEVKVPAAAAKKEFKITPVQRDFWSFRPIRKVLPPEGRSSTELKSPIDRFILASLEAHGLKPVPAADKRTLIRRATLDLTGLPPTPEEVEAFLNDPSPDAFASVVDRLLASPHYGERWGRYWLDIVRYGETDVRGAVPEGYESYPNAFRFRDWVISAFNQDMPYDLFVKAQIAGDLLGDNDPRKFLPGTGWAGLGPWYYDLTEPPQARSDERHDRVDTLTRGFLGLTVGCARCHDHKYDPISMKDYYGLAGVFASSEYREYPLAPENVVNQYRKHQKKIKDQEAAIQNFLQTQSTELGEILAHQTERYVTASWKVLGPQKLAAPKVAEADKLDAETLGRWTKYLSYSEKDHPFQKEWDALLKQGGAEDRAREVGKALQEVLLAVIAEKKAIDQENTVTAAKAVAFKKSGSEIHLPNGFSTEEEFCPNCYIEIKPFAREKFNFWNDLFTEYSLPNDPSKKEPGVLLYKDEKVERFLAGEWKNHLEILRAELEELKKTQPAPYPYLHGIAEAARPGDLKLHVRGSPYNLGELVPRRFLAVLSPAEPAPFIQGSGRLELAQAVASHPLTARVIVNRVWMYHFGRGIVSTPSNFGQLGERPSHPELLEYLAGRLIENHYSLKALHREIMLSAAYQLGSDYSEENFAKDSDNRLLWRFSRRRLDVEALRDSVLFVSGDLDTALGGPSVQLTDEDRRRTVYSKINRFKVDSFLTLFDFPDPSITSEQRNATNVPLQRLFFMNSPLIAMQADQLAKRLSTSDNPDDSTRIRSAYRILYGREARDSEVRLGLEFLQTAKSTEKQGLPPWQRYARVLLSSNEFAFVN